QATSNLQPLRASNAMNGYPAILFDNDQAAADYLRIADNSSLEGMSGLSAFAVFQLNAGTASAAPRGIFSKRDGVDIQEAYDWFIWNSGNLNLDIDNTNNRVSSSTTYTTGTNYLTGFVYKGSSPTNNQNQVLYDGTTAVGNGVESSASIPNYTSDLYIGVLKGHTGSGTGTTRFNGLISEVIIYNTALNDAQRFIVSNYLAAKYGLALSANDLYTQDDAGNGNFDHDVAGIGRVSSTAMQTDSRGTGIIQINGASDLNDGEFLFWGHNGGSLGTWGISDKPAGVQGRWQRVWRVSEVNTSAAAVDVGATDITFDLSNLGSVTASDLRLLVDASGNGLFADETPITGATSMGSGKYKFAGVTALVNGRRFTLGTANVAATPLPIELLSFTAKAEATHRVALEWITASERDNDHFTIERSADLQQWKTLLTTPGAGNSISELIYAAMDEDPLAGASYYRLRQVDTDGTSTLSDVVPVFIDAMPDITVFPVPTHDVLTVLMPAAETYEWTLFDAAGRTVDAPHTAALSRIDLDLADRPRGLYLLRWRGAAGEGTQRIVLE
ncbi:MAG TPA: T9SS type A sorting domain-containing protein, partial [Flavobacteriales bacterium]|nr:T9SS type A sorting domain-containing protein [Flavobacteriales bacterium]